MEFLNPYVSGDMAQLLQHSREKFVPCFEIKGQKIFASTVPLHGDQLFEERSRNVIWTYRDGAGPYEKMKGLEPEFVDWHAQFTLYKV